VGGGYSKIFELQRTAFQRPLQRSAFFEFVPYWFCFMNVHKLDFIFRTLLKFALLLGKRGLSKNIYIFKKQFNSRNYSESADRECIRPHASALKARGEKTHGRFPLVAPLFPLRLVPQRKKHETQNAAHVKNARSAITQRQRPQRKTQTATHAKSPHIIQNPAFIP